LQIEKGPAVATASSALATERRAAFEEIADDGEPRFLTLREGIFAELDGAGNQLAEVRFEYVLPRALSSNTVVAIPVAKTPEGVYTALEHRDLPAVQRFTGSSTIATAPAWRLPMVIKHRSEVPKFLNVAMARDFGIGIRGCWELGGPYYPTPGITPELVRPYAVEIDLYNLSDSPLVLVRLDDIMANVELIADAHLLIAIYRLSHAVGLSGASRQ